MLEALHDLIGHCQLFSQLFQFSSDCQIIFTCLSFHLFQLFTYTPTQSIQIQPRKTFPIRPSFLEIPFGLLSHNLFDLSSSLHQQYNPSFDFTYISMIRTLKLVRLYTQVPYSKFRITRTPAQSMVFFFKNEAKVGELLEHIRRDFPVNNNKLLLASAFQQTLIGYPALPQAEKATEEMSDELLVPLLLNGDLFVYEAVENRVQLCYGIQCEEFNQTNNRNLPERISDGIVQLNNQWLSARTIGEALAPPVFDPKDKEIIEDREQLKLSIQKAHMSLIQLARFAGDYYAGSPTHVFTVRMMAIMAANWSLLFAITYGKYGWDVGEPVSYLTSLGVDLAAMAGFFDLEKQLEAKLAEEQGRWWGVLNIEAQKRAQAWLLSYHRRQYY